MNVINPNLCLCRRSYKSKFQCKNKKKYGDYCGIHIKCYEKTGRIDRKSKKQVNTIDDITLNNYMNYNIHKMRMTDLKKLALKFNIYIKGIKKKKQLYNTIICFFKCISKISGSTNKINKLVKLQFIIKTKYIQNIFGLPNIYRNLSNNSIDINGDLIWSNNDDNKKIINIALKAYDIFGFYENNIGYCFTINAFEDNLKHYTKNPYTTSSFSPQTLYNFKSRRKYIDKNNNKSNIISKKQNLHLDLNKQNIKYRTIRVFQKIDSLGNYTDYKWFLNLSINRLKLMYFFGKDIWNYQFTDINQKRKIILPNGVAFQENYTRINSYRQSQKEELQNLVLIQIEKLVTQGESDEYAKIGAWIVLTCLVKSSREAQRALPYYV